MASFEDFDSDSSDEILLKDIVALPVGYTVGATLPEYDFGKTSVSDDNPTVNAPELSETQVR